MAKTSSKATKDLNTGQLIIQVLQTKRITPAALARAIHRPQSNISRVMKEPSTQAYILWEMSMALRHNLFTDIAAQLDAATEGRLQQGKVTMEAMQAEMDQLREERDTLMRVVAKLSK